MSAIFEQFHTEQDFYQDYLGVNEVQWQQWKVNLIHEKSLLLYFTDFLEKKQLFGKSIEIF
jgi:hypothetical protein